MKSYLLAFIFSLPCMVKAQGAQLGLGVGRSVYWGDLNAPEFISNVKNNGGVAIQIYGKFNYSGRLGLKAGFLLGKLKGNDAFSSEEWQKRRNLNFNSSLTELSLTAEYYLVGYQPYRRQHFFSPYITGGISGFHFNPTTDFDGNTYELQPLGTEGQGAPNFEKKYNKFGLTLPFGAGAIVKAGKGFDIGFEVIARRTFTDYIDDVSSNYVNYYELMQLNGELAAKLSDRTPEFLGSQQPMERQTGSQRGGVKVKDWYFTAMVNLSFNISDSDLLWPTKSQYRSYCPKF